MFILVLMVLFEWSLYAIPLATFSNVQCSKLFLLPSEEDEREEEP